MEISDIRVKLIQDSSDRLKAVCSITLDDEFVVRDLKVVEGTNGLFVAMPSRKLSVHCPQCRGKNHLRARFCNECGAKLPAPRLSGDAAGRLRMHRDIAHPINPAFREIVQSKVIEKYRQESELAKNPDYKPVDIDAEFEEQVAQVVESEPGGAYAPSEYDQLIAGLNKGPGGEGLRDRESRTTNGPPPTRGPRRDDRGRSQRGEQRQGRHPRGTPARSGPRTDTRRGFEPAKPSQPFADQHRQAPGLTEYLQDEELDEVNGNVALPEPPPPQRGRRPAGPSRRNDERGSQRRNDDRPPRRDRFDRGRETQSPRPAPSREVERPVARVNYDASEDMAPPPVAPREDPIAAYTPPPPPPVAPRPVQQPSAPKPGFNDDLPFGAGL